MFVLCALAIHTPPVLAERLTAVTEDPIASAKFLVDIDSIERIDGMAHAWVVMAFDKTQAAMTPKMTLEEYSYIKTSYFFNCAKHTIAIGSQTFFTAKHEITSRYPRRERDLKFHEVSSGSTGDALYKFVCGKIGGKDNRHDEENVDKSKFSPSQMTGSGFRVTRGAIITNYHVVDGCSRLNVNGVAAQVRGSDARSDLALLNATLPGPNATLRAQRAAVGEPLAVAGYPLRGLLSGFNMTTGSLSSLSGIGGDTRLVQITAPVQPGNSGGPVLDSAGNLMGVVVSKLDAVKAIKITGDIPQNVNFAINTNVLRSFLDANSVEYDTATSDKALATTAIAERAKGFTVLVECWK